MTSLELTPAVFEPDCLPILRTFSQDPFHAAIVSERVFRVLSAGIIPNTEITVEMRKVGGKRSVILLMISESSFTGITDFSVQPGTILVCPNVLESLGCVSIQDRVRVTLLREALSEATEVSLSEVCGSSSLSDKIHGMIVPNVLKHSRRLSVGEILAVPVWSSIDARNFSDVSEPSADVRSWIGPGRALMNNYDIVYYRVSDMSRKGEKIPRGTVSTGTKVLLASARREEATGPIPDMRRYLFPDIETQVNEEVVEWIERGEGPAIVLSDAKYNAVNIIENSAERCGFFSVVIDSAIASSSQSVLERLHPKHPRTVFAFTKFEMANGEIFSKIISEISKLKIIFVSSDFESAVKLVPSPTFFTHIIELASGRADEVQKTIKAYSKCLPRGCETSGQTLEKRLTATKASQDDLESPNVGWADIGGLSTAKQELQDLMRSGLRRGVLLYGPPGTGKTLLAKAIATESARAGSGVKFIGVKGPELLSMYIGESEKNVRDVFARAKAAAPCVVFFDELDSLAPARGRASDSANVMDRVVASLLTELDNVPSDVIIVGATNRPDLLDPALLRPGRIDRQVYIGVPEDKREILHALSRKFRMAATVVDTTSGLIPKGMTGSDLAGALRRAYLDAAKKIAQTITDLAANCNLSVHALQKRIANMRTDCENHSWGLIAGIDTCEKCQSVRVNDVAFTFNDFQVILHTEDVLHAAKTVKPSVSEEELAQYERLRDAHATVLG